MADYFGNWKYNVPSTFTFFGGGSTHNGHILTESRRALSPSLFLSLYSYFISSRVLCFKYVFVSQFHLLPPRFSLPLSHAARINLITLYARYYSAFSSVRLQQFHPHSGHIPYPHNHSIHHTIHYSFPFTDTRTIAPPFHSLPHQPLIPHINRTGIPIPVINNEF